MCITIQFRDDPKSEEPRSVKISTNVAYKPEALKLSVQYAKRKMTVESVQHVYINNE